MAVLTIEFPKPVTRARVTLGQNQATITAMAGTSSVTTATGSSGAIVSLFADPDSTGWFNRLVITAPGSIQLREICTDRGDSGWERYQQWTWRQGVQRSIEALYEQDILLPPGQYELRVHTAAVVTGDHPTTALFSVRADFKVGSPPGFPVALTDPDPPTADPRSWIYPYGGPLTDLATYVDHTMPEAGERLWYRRLDTAVGFNESYVTRMYLEADEELLVSVANSNDVALRPRTRHVWASGEAALDATTSLYIRTLAGDGMDPCASVDVSKIVLPQAVTAGAGELLDPSALHRSQLRTRQSDTKVHEFSFTTSLYASFLHLAATFDGSCARLTPLAQEVVWDPRAKAQTRVDEVAELESARIQALATIAAGTTGQATSAQIEAAEAAPNQLATTRAAAETEAALDFDDIWAKSLGAVSGSTSRSLRLSVVRVGNPTSSDILLLESPEPIAWNRVSADIASAAKTPSAWLDVMLTRDLGRPDQGFTVEYGGLQWLAGVELWFNEGALRARADEPLDVTMSFPRSTSVDLTLMANNAASIEATCNPPASQVAVTGPTADGLFSLSVTAPVGSTLQTVRIQGDGVGIVSYIVDTPFRPTMPTGALRIIDVKLPATTTDLTHAVTVMALSPISLDGWSVRWLDPTQSGDPQPYATCSTDVQLNEAGRARFFPSLANPPATDDAVPLGGGPGKPPPPAGAIFQLFDPDGRRVHDRAAMQSGITETALAIFPSADGSRAFLIPPSSAKGLAAGFWSLSLTFVGDPDAPDLEAWTVGGQPMTETANLPLLLEDAAPQD